MVVLCRIMLCSFDLNDFVGLGIGSSSTQAYARAADGSIKVGYDSTCGAKPTKAQAAVRASIRRVCSSELATMCHALLFVGRGEWKLGPSRTFH